MKANPNHPSAYYCGIAVLLAGLNFGCVPQSPPPLQTHIQTMEEIKPDWKTQLNDVMPLLGHRNWILIVDKAYPLQSAPGIRYINTDNDLLPVLNHVLTTLKASSHVQPIIYTDAELAYVTENAAPGADNFKQSLTKMLEGNNVQALLHNDVFSKLDQASKLFESVVLKTNLTIPYSSVFIELDCGYWSGEKENELRDRMK